jgi:hypothetical protein
MSAGLLLALKVAARLTTLRCPPQVEAAQKRAPFSERKEKKRKRAEQTDADPASEQQQRALAPASPSSPKNMPPNELVGAKVAPDRSAKRLKAGAQPNDKQRLVRTVALGNLSPEIRGQAIAYAESVTQV